MSPRHYLVPSVLVSIFIGRPPSVAHYLVFVPRSAPVPGNKAIGPASPAPSAILVLGAPQLTVPWVPLAALRALRRGPFRTVQECNSLKQAKLPACFGDLLRDLLLDRYFDLAPLPIGASPLAMPLVAASPAPPSLWFSAVLPDMSMLLAVEALDLVVPFVHEDRHFYWSSTSWYKGYELGGMLMARDGGCTKYAPHLHLEGVIQTCPLNAIHAVNQVALDDEILLLGVRYLLPGILENVSQGLLYIGSAVMLL